MIRILIVENEKPISDLIEMNLTDAGYACTCVYDGLDAADVVESGQFDLVLLDILLPKLDGYALMEYIRPLEIPVIFLTAKSTVEDRVRGLRLGADDYLAKPFEIVELLARVETVLRRWHKAERSLQVCGLQIDTLSHTVLRDGKPVNLTVKEYELMLLFIQNRNIALSRDRIYERIWGAGERGDSRTVDLHVQRLRRKAGWEGKLVTVYKVGYRLEG